MYCKNSLSTTKALARVSGLNPYDLQDKAKSQFYELDEDSEEYVMREVSRRIFASIGVSYFRLTQKYCMF